MPGLSLIDFRIKKGEAANPDNKIKAEISNCTRHDIDVNPAGWDRLREALVFKSPESILRVPSVDRLCNAQKFGVEMVIRPAKGDGQRMNLIVGQVLPMQLSLDKKDDAYLLKGQVKTKAGWVQISAEDLLIPINTWTTVGLVYNGRDLLLLKNGKTAARRVLDHPELAPIGSQGFIVGGAANGEGSYQGEIAGLRIYDDFSTSIELGKEFERVLGAGQGEIESKYQSLLDQNISLGIPLTKEISIGKGRCRSYLSGNIYWSADTGAHVVYGDILKCYLANKGPTGFLGFPMTDEFNGEKAGSRVSRFEGGAIYWHASTGAHEVHHAIFLRYLDLGGEKGFLGLPKTDEASVPGGGKNEFEGGTIFCSSQTGAREVHGVILQRFLNLAATGGLLGFPITNEEVILTKQGKDSGGRQSRFQGGTIYWSAASGAFEVHGAIRDLYEKLGGPLGKMGYPLTNETLVSSSDIRYNNFQNGIIIWRPGIGAREITTLRLFIGQVTCGQIDDGIDWFKKDKTPEIITYLTVRVNGNTLVNDQRRPSGHAATSYNVNYSKDISPVRSDTIIYWKVKVDDWDMASGNDYLGRREETFNIRNLWGILGGDPQGVYNDQPAQHKGGDTPSLHTLKFDYSIQPVQPIDPNKHFREQLWWRFGNFNTAVLTRDQFAETFRDVEHVEHWWDKLMSPIDWAIYEGIYKGLANKGNCFGMCLQALYARFGRSSLMEPLNQYKASGDKVQVLEADLSLGLRQPINHHHGYQLGDSAIRWYINSLYNLAAIIPMAVYLRVKTFLAMGDYPIICLCNLQNFAGHAVLAYKCVDGSGGRPHKILIADPNVPWRTKSGDDASYIEISPANNTFKLISNNQVSYKSQTALGGMLPTTLMVDIPFHQLSSTPRTPFWEIITALYCTVGRGADPVRRCRERAVEQRRTQLL
jgi:hypothetical protein